MVHHAAFARFENNPARQLAYQLWAADPTRPMSEWIDELKELVGGNVATRTVYEWKERDQWERRLAEEVLAASGVSVFEQVRRLRVAALPAISYLDSVSRGETKPDRLRMDAAKFLVQQAAALHQHAASIPNVALDTPKLGELSTEELLALASSAAEGE